MTGTSRTTSPCPIAAGTVLRTKSSVFGDTCPGVGTPAAGILWPDQQKEAVRCRDKASVI